VDPSTGPSGGSLPSSPAATGALLGWNPNGDGDVQALANDGQTVAAGGELNSAGGVNHPYLAAIDTATGQATGLDLGLDGSVTAIASGGQTLFIAGGFAHVQGQFRDFLAEFSPVTGQVTSWQPHALFVDNNPEALAVTSSTVYVGGEFNDLITGKRTVSRRALAAFSRSSGNLTGWNPSADGVVFAMAAAGGLIYAGGPFEHIGFTPRNGVAAITPQGNATSWNANVDLTGSIDALQIAGSTVYLGGSFDTVAGQPRVDLAAVTTSTGALLPWAPSTSPPFGTVQALAATGNTVYAGGNFLNLQGHIGLAAFTADTGALTPFQADINPGGEIATLATAPNGTLYVGGGFTDIAGSDHDNLAAITP
jgi:trimeric autotransporter adhesin